jgi:hypothetical protein
LVAHEGWIGDARAQRWEVVKRYAVCGKPAAYRLSLEEARERKRVGRGAG